ncbi:hypothetical protein JCM16814_19810 [Desulfobaculum senezii]
MLGQQVADRHGLWQGDVHALLQEEVQGRRVPRREADGYFPGNITGTGLG